MANFWRKKIWSGQVRSRSYDVIRGTTFDNISAKSWVNATWRGAIDLNGDSWWDWCQYMTGCDPWHRARRGWRSTKVTWGHWPRLNSQWQITNRHSLEGFPEVLNLNLWFIVPKNVSKALLPHTLGQSSSFDQFEFWPLRWWRPARVMPFYLVLSMFYYVCWILQRDTVKTLYLV